MSSLLPHEPVVDHQPSASTTVELTDERSGTVIQALGSETARAILSALDRSPATASELAERVDTSIQNVQYHLDRLATAELVSAVDTWYSAKGREMQVYAPTSRQLVIRNDDDHTTSSA